MPVEIHRDLRTPAGFQRENALPVQLPELGPTGQPWLRSTLVDGQTGAGSAVPNERADATFGGFPLNSRRILRWYERFIEMPTTNLDRWQVIGPEIHGPNVAPFDQALLMLEVGPDKRRRLNANAGRPSPRYDDIGPIEIGRPYAMLMDVYLTAGSNGYIRVWRDGVLVAQFTGATIMQATSGSYWKEANYRNAQINGPSTFDISDMMLYRADLADPLIDWPGPIVAPPPAVTPRVTIDTNDSGAYTVTLSDYGDVASLLVGVAGDPFPPISLQPADEIPGRFLPLALTPGTTYWSWVVARDAAGRELTSDSDSFTPVAPPPPPPDPDPVDPCAEIRLILAQANSDLNAAREGRDQALDALVNVTAEREAAYARIDALRSAIAAEEIRHAEAVAGILDAA